VKERQDYFPLVGVPLATRGGAVGCLDSVSHLVRCRQSLVRWRNTEVLRPYGQFPSLRQPLSNSEKNRRNLK
jgi:hypothetical protein